MTEYFTIETPTEGLYKEKGSKFLSFAFPVISESQIKHFQDDLRKKYHDARHHCYAWILGMDDQIWRANDDGEPNHSAGDPILGQIRSFELTNTLIIVVRYFGGTKLGVGGLINAYKTAAEMALSKAAKKQIFETLDFEMVFGYNLMSTVERLITDFEINVSDRDFRENCKILCNIRKDLVPEFRARIQDVYELKVNFVDNE